MNTVEIIVMFEDSQKRRELEKRRAEEERICADIKQLQELEELIDEAKAEAEKIKDRIKDEMKRREVDEMKVGKYIVRWSEVLSNRFDTTAFKKIFPEVYNEFTKVVSSRRFTISG